MERFTITNGPSSLELSTSLFYGDWKNRIAISFRGRFSTGPKEEIELLAKVSGATREDGSGQSWNIIVFLVKTDQLATGHYSTKSRRGFLDLKIDIGSHIPF
ncbi:MAG: hypothetical protein AAB662_00075 [Patescibacteria group bacterium]